jgi:hypothetical protein
MPQSPGGCRHALQTPKRGRAARPATNVPGNFAADRRTTTAASACAGMSRRSCAQEQPPEGVCPNARENGQISPSTSVRAARRAGSRLHLASVLQDAEKARKFTPVRRFLRPRAALIAFITWSGMRSTVSNSCNGSNRLTGPRGPTSLSMSVASRSWQVAPSGLAAATD